MNLDLYGFCWTIAIQHICSTPAGRFGVILCNKQEIDIARIEQEADEHDAPAEHVRGAGQLGENRHDEAEAVSDKQSRHKPLERGGFPMPLAQADKPDACQRGAEKAGHVLARACLVWDR